MDSSKKARAERALRILGILTETYPGARPHLDFRNPFELLVATILAAQCTDKKVNEVTPALFRRFPDAARLAEARPEELEEMVRSTGFFRSKARSLKAMAGALVKDFGGTVPGRIDELVGLPGVGRKTANVVAGNCFGFPAIMVDTHFKRVIGRLELTGETDPDRIEAAVRELVPEEHQTRFSLTLNEHGRRICVARKPLCEQCPLRPLCPFPEAARS